MTPILIAVAAFLFVVCAMVSVFVLGMSGWGKTLRAIAVPGDSLRAAQAAVAARPRDPAAHLALGIAYAGVRQYNPAFAEYDTAISLDPRNPRAYEQAGELAVEVGDLARAERYYSRGRAESQDDVGLLIAQGDLFFTLKRYGEARTNYLRVERIAPGNAEAVWRVADVDQAQGRQLQALASRGQAAAIWLGSFFR